MRFQCIASTHTTGRPRSIEEAISVSVYVVGRIVTENGGSFLNPCSDVDAGPVTATGLVLHSCPNIQALLSTAADSQLISPDLRDAAVQYLEAPVVPYPVVRDIWVQLTPGYGVPFHQVLAGSSFVLESPKPPEKGKELKECLAELQELADVKAHKEIVKDVTKHEYDDEDREYLSSYKNSLGFGLHIVFIMFTGYMFGYAIFRSQFPDSPSMHAAGVFGLIAGMLVETILFTVRVEIAEKNSDLKVKVKLKAKQVLHTSAEVLGLPQSVPAEVLFPPSVQGEEAPFGVRKRCGHVQPLW